MMQQFVKFLSSLRLTIYLILALGCIFLLGLCIPQANVLKMEAYLQWKNSHPHLLSLLEALRLTRIYTSPLTIILWVGFFLNLALVMWKRVPAVLKKIRFSQDKIQYPREATGYVCSGMLVSTRPVTEERLRLSLQRRGYKFHGTTSNFYAVKNRLSPCATILFHLSFFLMLLGGLINMYSRFSGNVDLSEGESFQGELTSYNAPPRLPKVGTPPRTFITVEKVSPETVDGMPTRLAVTISDRFGKRHLAEINRPYREGATSFVVTTIGVTPLFVLTDRQGREADGAYVKLNVLGGKQDNFTLLGYRINARFYPDYFREGATEGTRSTEFKRPAFHLQIWQEGRTLAEKTLQQGDSLDMGDYTLSFRQMPFWVRLYVVKEYGLETVYAGFVLAIAALVWRFVFYRRELVGAMVDREEGAVLYLAGRSEFYRNLYEDEFEAMVKTLERREEFTRGEN